MVAGLATLRTLTPDAYARLSSLTARLAADFRLVFQETGVHAQMVIVGSIFRVRFMARPPLNYGETVVDDKELHKKLFFWLLNHRILWAQGGYVSLPMEDGHVDRLVAAVRTALDEL